MSYILGKIKTKFLSIDKDTLSKIYIIFIFSFLIRLLIVNLDNPFILHPDEPTIVNSTINLRYDLNPKHFDWPTLTYYLNYPLYFIVEKTDAFFINYLNIDLDLVNFFNYYLVTRIFTALMSSIGAVFIFLTLKNFGLSLHSSFISSLIFSLAPFFLHRSSQALPDAPMVFFGILMVYFLSKYLINPKYYFLVLSSLMLGFSISSKYTGYLFGITLAGFLIIKFGFSINLIKKSALLVLVTLFGFVIGTPYSVLDLDTFLIDYSPKGALWQFQNVGKTDNLLKQSSNFLENLFVNQASNFGYLPIILTIIYTFYVIYNKIRFKKIILPEKVPFILFLLFVFQFFYIFWSVSGISDKSQRAQHFLPALPFVIIILSLLLNSISIKLINMVYALFIAVNLYSYLGIVETDPAVRFYYYHINSNKEVAKGTRVLYKEDRLKDILEKLGYDTKKYSKKNESYSRFVISTSLLCKDPLECGYMIKQEISSDFGKNKLFIFEKIEGR